MVNMVPKVHETAHTGVWSTNKLLEELNGFGSICRGRGMVDVSGRDLESGLRMYREGKNEAETGRQ